MIDAQRRERETKMINTPKDWPAWPVLPMKQRLSDTVRAGFSVTADYPTVVLKDFPTAQGILLQLACEDGHLFEPGVPPESQREVQAPARELYESRIEARYEDIDSMLDDGWVVD